MSCVVTSYVRPPAARERETESAERDSADSKALNTFTCTCYMFNVAVQYQQLYGVAGGLRLARPSSLAKKRGFTIKRNKWFILYRIPKGVLKGLKRGDFRARLS